MLLVIITMLLSLGLAAGIALYVAFPHRGEDVPRAAWLGRSLRRGVESLPTIEGADDDVRDVSDLSELVRHQP